MAEWWERDGLEYRKGRLVFGGVDAEELAKEFGTPIYVYDADRIVDNFTRMQNALEEHADRDIHVCYAVKANPSMAILDLLYRNGCRYLGAVSPNECRLGIEAGFDPYDIMFTGTSVSMDTLREIRSMGVFINVDSETALRYLREIEEESKGKTYDEIAIRWNPNRGAGWHPDVITAGREAKFGIPEDRVLPACELAREYGKSVVGLHQHIGSNWKGKRQANIFLETVDSTLEVACLIGGYNEKYNGKLRFVNFGGGPGIRYKESDSNFPLRKYAKGICDRVRESKASFQAIEVEPGRYIVGDAGILLDQVVMVEEKNGILFIGGKAGFNTLIRPAFYGAYHEIVSCEQRDSKREARVVGPLCESGDILTRDKEKRERVMQVPENGDYFAVLNAGAYGFAMASNYNLWPLPAEVMIYNGKPHLIRGAQTYEDLRRGQFSLNELGL